MKTYTVRSSDEDVFDGGVQMVTHKQAQSEIKRNLKLYDQIIRDSNDEKHKLKSRITALRHALSQCSDASHGFLAMSADQYADEALADDDKAGK